MSRRFATALILLGLSLPALSIPDWSKVRLSVSAGEGTPDFHLGEPVPESWPKSLGRPDLIFPFHGTGEGLKRIAWGVIKKGQLQQGMAILTVGSGEDSNIIDIEIKRIRAGVDGENLFLGLPEERVSKRSELVQKDGKHEYLLPGLTIEAAEGKLIGLRVHSPASTRWRFKRWRVRPGKAAGPVKLGQKVEKSLFQAIGEPHEKSREEMLWQASDSQQSLMIRFDPITGEVTRIRGVGLPWRTPNGATLGDTMKKFLEKHPDAKETPGRGIDDTILKLPGLRANFSKGKLESFDIYDF